MRHPKLWCSSASARRAFTSIHAFVAKYVALSAAHKCASWCRDLRPYVLSIERLQELSKRELAWRLAKKLAEFRSFLEAHSREGLTNDLNRAEPIVESFE